jgi:hypothetical protein
MNILVQGRSEQKQKFLSENQTKVKKVRCVQVLGLELKKKKKRKEEGRGGGEERGVRGHGRILWNLCFPG